MGKGSRRRRRARWGIKGSDARLGAAAATFGSGLIHLHLGLVTAPDHGRDGLGRLFLVAAAMAFVIAVALVLGPRAVVRLAGAALLVATTVAFVLSRAGLDILGSSSAGLAPSPHAPLALLCAVVGIVLLLLTFLEWVGGGAVLGRRAAGGVVVGGLAVAALAAMTWSRDGGEVLAVRTSPVTVGSAVTATSDGGPVTTARSTTDAPTTVESATTTERATTPTQRATTTTELPTTTTEPVATTPGLPRTTGAPPTTAAPTTTAAPPTTAPPETVRMRIGDYGFDPDVLEVRAGTTVAWVLDGSWDHSVVALDASFDSGPLEGRGTVFEHTFDEPGLYPYRDGGTPGLEGVIVVVP